MRLILLGAPGSGKGTQSQKLIERYGVPQISTGDLLRDACNKGSPLGLKAKGAMAAGKLVDNTIVLGIIRERLAEPDARGGFILDGFPRNRVQADALGTLLAELRAPVNAVVLMDIDTTVLFKRLTGRRVCPNCKRVYNVYSDALGDPARCTHCQDRTLLVQRPDDREDVIDNRLKVYAAETQPLIEYYAEQGLLRHIDAEGSVEEVFARIERAIAAP